MLKTNSADWDFIRNPKERKLVKLSVALGILLVFFSFLFVTPLIAEFLSMSADVYNLLTRTLNAISQRVVMISVIFSTAWYIATKLMKICKEKNRLPSHTLISFAKIAKLYHAPTVILALGFALVHAYINILNEVKFNLGYITGFITLALFILVSFSGVRRYLSKHKLHLVSSISMIALLAFHIIYFMIFKVK